MSYLKLGSAYVQVHYFVFTLVLLNQVLDVNHPGPGGRAPARVPAGSASSSPGQRGMPLAQVAIVVHQARILHPYKGTQVTLS